MKNYKITVQYDGTAYNGWQRQGNTKNTIQEKIENILGRMTGHRVEIHGSGRTDKGVHARCQVASFKISTDKSDAEILEYVNRYLPEDIGVVELCETDDRFHARLLVKKKTYAYRIRNSNVHNAFEHRYMYAVEKTLDVEKMDSAAKCLLGEHDFLGFSSVKKPKKSTVRTVFDAKVERFGDEVRFTVTGSGFLYNSVRIMAGTMLEVGLGEREPDSVQEIFEKKSREFAGETLPAKGLTLMSVEY